MKRRDVVKGFPTFEYETRCPHCGEVQESATQVAGAAATDGPTPGQYAFCFHCGEWSVFTRTLSLRKPRKAEARELATDIHYTKIRDAWVQVQDEKA